MSSNDHNGCANQDESGRLLIKPVINAYRIHTRAAAIDAMLVKPRPLSMGVMWHQPFILLVIAMS